MQELNPIHFHLSFIQFHSPLYPPTGSRHARRPFSTFFDLFVNVPRGHHQDPLRDPQATLRAHRDRPDSPSAAQRFLQSHQVPPGAPQEPPRDAQNPKGTPTNTSVLPSSAPTLENTIKINVFQCFLDCPWKHKILPESMWRRPSDAPGTLQGTPGTNQDPPWNPKDFPGSSQGSQRTLSWTSKAPLDLSKQFPGSPQDPKELPGIPHAHSGPPKEPTRPPKPQK